MSDTLLCLGHIDVESRIITPDGIRTERQRVKNLVVDQGLNTIRNLMSGNVTAWVTHMGVGTSASAVTAAQTDLVAIVGRLPITEYVTSTSKVVQFKLYIGSTDFNANTLREIGLFTASTGTTLFARALLASPITKNNTTTVTITWTHTLSAT